MAERGFEHGRAHRATWRECAPAGTALIVGMSADASLGRIQPHRPEINRAVGHRTAVDTSTARGRSTKLHGVYRHDSRSSHSPGIMLPCLTPSRSGAVARSTCRVTRRPGSHTPELSKPAAAAARSNDMRLARVSGCGSCCPILGLWTLPGPRRSGRLRMPRPR
jgi:hypothetical protein